MKQCSQSIGFNLQRLVRGQGPAGSPQPQVKDAAAIEEREQFVNVPLSPQLTSAEPPPFSLRHQWGSPDNLIDTAGLASSVKSPTRSDKGRCAAEKWSVKSGLPPAPSSSLHHFFFPSLFSCHPLTSNYTFSFTLPSCVSLVYWGPLVRPA